MRDPTLPTRTREKIAADNRAELDGWIDERVAELIARGHAARRSAATSARGVRGRRRRAADTPSNRTSRPTGACASALVEELAPTCGSRAHACANADRHRGRPADVCVGHRRDDRGVQRRPRHAPSPPPVRRRRTLVYLQPVDNGVIGPAARFSAATWSRCGSERRRSRASPASKRATSSWRRTASPEQMTVPR